MITILLALALTVRSATVAVDRVELNHYTVDGEHRFTQVILWRTMRMERWVSHVANWRLLKDDSFSRSREGGYHVIRFRHDHQQFVIHARHYHETTTAVDPEWVDRQSLNETDRMSYFAEVEECQ